MLSSIVKFCADAEGLEKSLRLFQYLSQTGAAIFAGSISSGPWAQAHEQFALARRYFRLLSWYESFGIAHRQFHRDQAPLRKALEVSKWSFLGLYFFFEMWTLTNAIGVTNYSWAPAMQHEANKYWLYAIVSSIFVSLHQLFLSPGPSQEGELKDRDDKKATPVTPAQRTKIYRQLVIDCADVIIPLFGVGWVSTGDVFADEKYVGIAGTISTLVSGQELWDGVQSRFASVGP